MNGSLVVFPGDGAYTGAGALYAVIRGTEILTPTVALAEGEMPDGSHLDLITDLVEATGTVVAMTLDTSARTNVLVVEKLFDLSPIPCYAMPTSQIVAFS